MRSAVIWRTFTGSFPSPGHHSMPIASEPLVLCSTFIVCVCRTMSNLCLDPKDAFLALIRRWSFTGPKRVVFSSPKMPIKCSLPRGLTGQARHTEFRKLKPVQSWFGRPSSGAKVSFELSVGCWIDWIVPSMLL